MAPYGGMQAEARGVRVWGGWVDAREGCGSECWDRRGDVLTCMRASQGREGVVIVKTTQAMLVTHYPESVQPGAAANTVEQLADYLIKVGY